MRSSLRRSRLGGMAATFVIGLAGFTVAAGQDDMVVLSDAERELVGLRQEYKDAKSVYWRELLEYQSRDEVLAAYESGELVNPDAEYIPRLLAFEARHRGDGVGINALLHVFRVACQGGDHDSPSHLGAREAAERLKHYTASPLLPRAVDRASCYSLQSAPSIRTALGDLLGTDAISRDSREVIRFLLAKAALEVNAYLPAKIKRLAKLESGEIEPQWPEEASHTRRQMAELPTIQSANAAATAALETLRELAADDQSPRLRRLQKIDADHYVVDAVEDPESRRLAEIAAALLFKEEHLVVDAIAPAVEVELFGGDTWRMADQRGKVVVIQFSFTGCGPCERMYPDLADMNKKHGDRLEILTLMRDKTSEHVEQAVRDGKFTWSVALDGEGSGRISHQWTVDSFPEVYVIDQAGKIVAIGLRGERLREEVERLLVAED